MKSSQKRLLKELKEVHKTNLHNCTIGPIDMKNLYIWSATIIGPKGSPYEGGVFKLNIEFPETYPFKPPKVRFVTKIYHCNIDPKGNICADILKNNWSPALTISKIILSISSLLTDPNPDDPLVPSIAAIYREDKKKYENNAKRWTQNFA